MFQETQYRQANLSPNRHWEYTEYGEKFKNKLKSKHEPNKLKKYDNKSQEQCAGAASRVVDDSSSKNRLQFKLCSYNLLAPHLLDDNAYLYRNVHRHYLDWNYRKFKILNEIKRLNADVSRLRLLALARLLIYFFLLEIDILLSRDAARSVFGLFFA